MSALYDQRGNYLGELGAGDFVPDTSIGASIWDFLHPGQVQEEYAAVGKEPPSVTDIMTGAGAQAVEQTGQAVVGVVTDATKYIILAGAAYLAYQIFKSR